MLRRWTLSLAWATVACAVALGLTLAAGIPRPQPALALRAAAAARTVTSAGIPSVMPVVPPLPDWEERAAEGPHPAAVKALSPAKPTPAGGRTDYHIASRGGSAGDRLAASWYGAEFQGLSTASGEPFDRLSLTAAHRTLPLGTRVMVTNLKNGKSVEVRVNDRGPFVSRRDIDLSEAAFAAIAPLEAGVIPVRLQISR